jgi:iron-sulfur cluster assembly accessory protein
MTLTEMQPLAIVEATPKAIAQWQRLLADGQHIAIRLGVLGGGCAGLQYDMQPATSKSHGDFEQRIEGVTLYIHPVAAAYLKGTVIDYSDAMVDGGFKFTNPNATSTCGCGTSFGV